MKTRDYDRLIKRHARLPLHDGFAICPCALAQRLKAEAIRRAQKAEPRRSPRRGTLAATLPP